MFEIHISTMGSQPYADSIRRLLDPCRNVIKGSVIGLGGFDEFGAFKSPPQKKLEGVLAGTEPAAVILDDTAEVWTGYSENLIVCERYMYFPSACKNFGVVGPSLLERGVDESEKSGTLATVLEVLTRVHSEFFARRAARQVLAEKQARAAAAAAAAASSVDPRIPVTVPKLLADERKNVLRGVEIVFSGVFDHNDKTLTPREHPLWRLAERLGARVVSEPGTSTTHVVAKCVGTDLTHKAMWGLQYLKHVVSPAWVEASAMMWTRQDEGRFPVKRPK
jgi:RNA polymerase II C-terminal domain phosphatase-like 3/4